MTSYLLLLASKMYYLKSSKSLCAVSFVWTEYELLNVDVGFQEAQVIQRIAELRREGLWSTRRLPKVQEPPRSKAHWDYLLEEMQWLAADFAQERKWKKAGARKVCLPYLTYVCILQRIHVNQFESIHIHICSNLF